MKVSLLISGAGAMILAGGFMADAPKAQAAITYQLTPIVQSGVDGDNNPVPVSAMGDSTNTNLWNFDAPVDTLVSSANRTQFPKRIDLGRTGDSGGETLRMAQTFRVSDAFTVNHIQLLVWNVVPNQDVALRVFGVDDTNSIVYPTNPSNILWNAAFNQAEPNNNTLFNAYLLDIALTGPDVFTLPASAGEAGYAFEMSVDATTTAGYLQWEGAVFDPVPDGVSLEYFSDGTSGQYASGRAFVLSMATVPEPATLGLVMLGGLALLSRKRR